MMEERDMEANGGSAPSAARLPYKNANLMPNATAPRKKVEKPLWAMTENEKDSFEDDVGNDLINFAEGLDYDKFIGDLEFREGLAALRDRAGKLQKEQDAFKD